MSKLETDLENALMDTMMGDPWGPSLKGRLQREAKTVLMRHGMGRARVLVSHHAGTVQVRILLPPGPQRVRELRISLG